MDAETADGTFHVESVTLMTSELRVSIPPAQVRDLQKLLALEALGFTPHTSVHFDHDQQCFVLELDGDAVTHLLDLLSIAIDDRNAETWAERQDRLRSQYRLDLTAGSEVNLR